ncbi:MAG: sigma 54-interacting transcriptional regulator [Deltaproteobacteria bacterium]|nr:sigma 54-interacting transcriptional regulator [Deltaproteobacteria bacterium]MBW2033644.1 sigma 54-interacting transcriptional regulator [Deltaproteobacteria bacterium]MBW2357684.1 sigma 54-interacting transcriptional regulator [Deltaproteobacteria bacterium]
MFEQELSAYWETVVNTIQDGLMVVDRAGTILSVNRALEAITGFSKEDLIGSPCSALHCDICEIARDENGDHWCVLFRTGSLKMRRCTLARKDGRYVHVLKNASLLHDSNGNTIGAVETLTDITEIIQKDHQIEAFQREIRSQDRFHGILGTSASMQKVFSLIDSATQSDAPVIIFGESGTGKELVAEAIHETGARRGKPFMKVNCAALNESLLESELFGHVKGAFTGAYRTRKGRFEAARGGDIFLDEIGDLPLSTQVKLLRVLEETVIERVGENTPIQVDVRIVSATNKDLEGLVEKGLFREDLFYRINVIPISVPPLRERVEDIPLLAQTFFRRVRMKTGKDIQGISEEAMKKLVDYHWPGNVRELKSAFEYAFVSCQDSIIQPHHLPTNILWGQKGQGRPTSVPVNRDEIKKRQLLDALEKAGGNQSKAARILGVSRVTVWNRMKKFNINLRREIGA